MPARNENDPRWKRIATAGVVLLCLAYAVFAIAIWMLLSLAGDRWWPATFLLFSPRWIWVVPVVVLLPLALAFRKRWALVVVAAAAVILFGPMRFRVPVRVPWSDGASGRTVRLVTANLHNRQADPAVLDAFVAQTHADVVVLQDYASIVHLAFLRQPGWHAKASNGLLIASRWPLTYRNWFTLADPPPSDLESKWFIPIHGAVMCCEVEAPGGTFRLVNLHLSSPHRPLDTFREDRQAAEVLLASNSNRRRKQSQAIARQVRQIGGPFVLAGDFNTPDDSPIFRSSWSDFSDAFDTAGFGFGTTYVKHHTWLRIDHVLYGAGWHCRSCYTSGDVGSGHRAVYAELAW